MFNRFSVGVFCCVCYRCRCDLLHAGVEDSVDLVATETFFSVLRDSGGVRVENVVTVEGISKTNKSEASHATLPRLNDVHRDLISQNARHVCSVKAVSKNSRCTHSDSTHNPRHPRSPCQTARLQTPHRWVLLRKQQSSKGACAPRQ